MSDSCCRLDVGQSAPTESRQDRVHVAYLSSESAPTTYLRSLHTDVRLQFPCFCTRPQQVGLLQQSPDRLACHIQHLQSVQNAAARLIFNLRPCDHITRSAHQPSLAPRAGANYIQGGDADVSCTAWLRTTLLGVVIHMCRRHAAPTQAQVRLH